jgi:protein-tyrosine phosphatase
MRAAAKEAGRTIGGAARQVCKKDFIDFNWIFCMDNDNYDALMSMGADPEKTHLLLEFVESQTVRQVPDPYYGGSEGFTNVISLLERAVCDLIDRLLATTS